MPRPAEGDPGLIEKLTTRYGPGASAAALTALVILAPGAQADQICGEPGADPYVCRPPEITTTTTTSSTSIPEEIPSSTSTPDTSSPPTSFTSVFVPGDSETTTTTRFELSTPGGLIPFTGTEMLVAKIAGLSLAAGGVVTLAARRVARRAH